MLFLKDKGLSNLANVDVHSSRRKAHLKTFSFVLVALVFVLVSSLCLLPTTCFISMLYETLDYKVLPKDMIFATVISEL